MREADSDAPRTLHADIAQRFKAAQSTVVAEHVAVEVAAVHGQLVVLACGHRRSSLVAKKGLALGLTCADAAVAELVAVAGGGDDVGVMAEPVEQGYSRGLVG